MGTHPQPLVPSQTVAALGPLKHRENRNGPKTDLSEKKPNELPCRQQKSPSPGSIQETGCVKTDLRSTISGAFGLTPPAL